MQTTPGAPEALVDTHAQVTTVDAVAPATKPVLTNPMSTTKPAGPEARAATAVSEKQDPIARWKDLAAPAESTFTILAILGATLWFFLRRQRFPHANVRHDIKYWHVGNRILLHVVLAVTNVGDVVLRLRNMKTRIQQLLPTPADIRNDIVAGRDPVKPGETEILWPDIALRECNWKWNEAREVEPGETDEFHFEFALPADVQAVEVYTHVRNQRKRFRRIGWKSRRFAPSETMWCLRERAFRSLNHMVKLERTCQPRITALHKRFRNKDQRKQHLQRSAKGPKTSTSTSGSGSGTTKK